MKVLMVVPAVGDIYGGTSKIVIELAEALGKTNVHLDIATTSANGESDLNVPTDSWVEKESYRIRYFQYSKRGDYKFSLALTRWLYRHIKDYDIVHTHAVFSYPVLPAYQLCHWYRIPYIMSPHGMLEPWALAYKAEKKRLYFNLVERRALRHARAIHVTASPEAESVWRLGIKTPVLHVPNGIDKMEFMAKPDTESFYEKFPETRGKRLILFLGRIDPKKGLDLLALALKRIRESWSDAHLIVAGPDNIGFTPTARGYFMEAGCLDAVTFAGMLTGMMKHAALAAATVYVAPSYSEGFSMSILEGMASGLPCIFTTLCNFPEAAEAKVAHVIDVKAEALTSKLSMVFADPEGAKQMGNAARDFILGNYTWAQSATKLAAFYHNIIKGNS